MPGMSLLERDVVAQVKDWLLWHGYVPYRLHSGGARFADGTHVKLNAKGTPDYAVLHADYPGFLMETKRTDGKLREAQIKKQFEIQKSFRLSIANIDSLDAIKSWLTLHETRGRS